MKYIKKFCIVNVESLNNIGIIPLYSIVAKKLIHGHIKQTVVHIYPVSISIGLSFFGFSFLNRIFGTFGPIKNISLIYASINSTGISFNAHTGSTFSIPWFSIVRQ